jgi:OFA family oxalate/formate antiporter-like MFS transporter
MGVVYGAVLLLASRVLCLPPSTADATAADIPTPHERRVASRFGVLWCVFFINIATGILLIALAKPMLKTSFLFGDATANAIVAAMGLCNGFGRLFWSAASDRFGRFRTWGTMLLLQTLLFAVIVAAGSPARFAIAICIIMSCYGAGFALCPAMVADLFGPRRSARLYGVALTAWSAAALVGPPLAANLREWTGGDSTTLVICASASAAGWVLLMMLSSLARRQTASTAAAELAALR